MSAWRISSCGTLSGAPVSSKSVLKVCLNVCQPMRPNPQRKPAGVIWTCCTPEGYHGALPALNGLANTQSPGLLNGVLRCDLRSTSASAESSGIPAFEYLVLTSLTTPFTIA